MCSARSHWLASPFSITLKLMRISSMREGMAVTSAQSLNTRARAIMVGMYMAPAMRGHTSRTSHTSLGSSQATGCAARGILKWWKPAGVSRMRRCTWGRGGSSSSGAARCPPRPRPAPRATQWISRDRPPRLWPTARRLYGSCSCCCSCCWWARNSCVLTLSRSVWLWDFLKEAEDRRARGVGSGVPGALAGARGEPRNRLNKDATAEGAATAAAATAAAAAWAGARRSMLRLPPCPPGAMGLAPAPPAWAALLLGMSAVVPAGTGLPSAVAAPAAATAAASPFEAVTSPEAEEAVEEVGTDPRGMAAAAVTGGGLASDSAGTSAASSTSAMMGRSVRALILKVLGPLRAGPCPLSCPDCALGTLSVTSLDRCMALTPPVAATTPMAGLTSTLMLRPVWGLQNRLPDAVPVKEMLRAELGALPSTCAASCRVLVLVPAPPMARPTTSLSSSPSSHSNPSSSPSPSSVSCSPSA
mmetsp:Transcript_18132/g.39037  ORF Transcript_18132/g.39037 Transcript_18132/m.39037 type:complete len:473 (+) Transcript_18132:1379-2797(+)